MGKSPVTWQALSRRGWLVSPHLERWQQKAVSGMRARLPAPRDGLWLLSSGTSGVRSVKALHLSLESLLLSARTVNRFLGAGPRDIWLLALPEYHVGGLGVLARAELSGASVVRYSGKWDARKFFSVLERERVTLVSLVPTQIYDLVAAGLRAPSGLRAVIVGGGALPEDLYFHARELGWPLLPSYGLTECCSQVATASLESLNSLEFPRLRVLPHVWLETREQRIFLKSDSLCRWIAVGSASGELTVEDPRRDGWLRTSDFGDFNAEGLRVLGRADDVCKILGELVAVREVEAAARDFFGELDLHVAAVRDVRQEHSLILFTSCSESLRELSRRLEAFNSRTPGPRRIARLCWVPEIPRGELGKVKTAELVGVVQS